MLTVLFNFAIVEGIVILFALAMFAFVPILIVGLFIYKFKQQKKNAATFQQIAQETGLQMKSPGVPRMHGIYKGFEIEMALSSRRTGYGEDSNTEYFTYCEAYFPHSLRFLLDVSCPQGWFDRVANSTDIKIGNSAFDKHFSLKCYDREVASRLLLSDFPSNSTQNLMGDLMQASRAITYIDITDHEVYTEKTKHISDPNDIKQMLEITTYLAGRFQTAREKFPLAKWEKQMFHTWQKFADENDFEFNQTSIEMKGVYRNLPVSMALKTDKKNWQTQVDLKFPQSLMTGLKIMPENSVHKALSWFGMQDIQSGIKEFDNMFIVKGDNIQMAKHKLQPDFCNQLVAMKRMASDVLIDDESMSWTFNVILGDEQTLLKYLDGVNNAARMLFR